MTTLGPVDAAAAAGPVDGANDRAAHESLGRRPTDAAAHSLLENRANERPVSHVAHRPRLRGQLTTG